MIAKSHRYLKKLLQLQKLTPAQWVDLSAALVLLPLTAVGLKILGFRRMQRVLSFCPSKRTRQSAEKHKSVQRARLMAEMVSLAARYGPYRATCLKKALVLHCMLERAGIVARLKIGVRKGPSHRVEAHAWVESSGIVLLDDSTVDERFAAFGSPPQTHESDT